MKKVLALVLAVMMLSTMAFADTDLTTDENTVTYTGDVAPGDTIYIWKGMTGNVGDTEILDSGAWAVAKQINSDNYTITSKKIVENKALVESITFDDKNNQVAIKFVEDYTLKQAKTVKGTFVLKGIGKNKAPNIKIRLEVRVCNSKGQMYLDVDNDRTIPMTDANATPPEGVFDNTIYKFQKTTAGEPDAIDGSAHSTSDYGTVVLNANDGDTEVTFRAYKNDEFFLYNNTSANNALLKAYADQDAEISFLNFVANPTLNSTATVRFYKDEESHVYVMKDGKLVNEVKWDEDESCFLLKTRTLGAYVFSDKALPFNVETTANPDTGANDVVGIATALAAVALVSAAAVSLKK